MSKKAARTELAASRGVPCETAASVSWTPSVLEKLSRLSLELQNAAIILTMQALPAGTECVLLRHVDWQQVAKVQASMLANPLVRIAWLHGKKLYTAAEGKVLAPAYPKSSLENQALLCRGYSPKDIAQGLLTANEAHRWLSSDDRMSHWTPTQWLAYELPGSPVIEEHAVVRWATGLKERGLWAQLTKVRKLVWAGEKLDFCYADRLCDIREEDLTHGEKTGINEAFRRASERLGEEFVQNQLKDHVEISSRPAHWPIDPCVRVLRTAAEMAQEGRDMSHCGARFAMLAHVHYMLSINVLGHRSSAHIYMLTK